MADRRRRLGLVVVLAIVLLNVLGGGGASSALELLEGQEIGTGQGSAELQQECHTGQDANERQDCRIVADINSSRRTGRSSAATATRPRTPSSSPARSRPAAATPTPQVGPFYCPADKHVYIDLGFFDELQSRFGAEGGPFAEAYVLAHEYGHHVQDLIGDARPAAATGSGAEGGSVRVELQADCYAGVWAEHAVETGLIEELTQADIDQGLDAAARRRRPHPGADAGPGEPGDVDARLVRAAPALVRARLRDRRAGPCDTFSGSI